MQAKTVYQVNGNGHNGHAPAIKPPEVYQTGTAPDPRLQPHHFDSEEALLGSIIISADSLVHCDEVGLGQADFFIQKHGTVFDAMKALGPRCDLVTLSDELERRGQLEDVGGLAWLTGLMNSTPTHINAPYYARIIKRESIRRSLIDAAGEIARLSYDSEDDDPQNIIQAASDILLKVATGNQTGEARPAGYYCDKFLDNLDGYYKSDEETNGLPTGLTGLDKILGGLQRGKLILLGGRPGMGKCLGRGTKVLMYDGTLKPVEGIRVGDKLMGVDSTPRNVLSLARGREQMYWIRQRHGVDYRVNGSHILSLKRSRNEGGWTRGDIINISVSDYLLKSSKFKSNFKGYKVAVDFPEKDLPLDPYFIGLWLGDGTTGKSTICTSDLEVVEYLNDYAFARQEYVNIGLKSGASNLAKNYLITGGRSQMARDASIGATLRRAGLIDNKHIPENYLINSRANRLALLAGLIDSDGHYQLGQGGPYEITLKNKHLAEQVKFLCDSLGYSTSLIPKQATIQKINFSCEVYRIRFNGNVDEIPVKIARKKAKTWCGFKDWQVTGITVEKDIIDDYFGFTVDGDNLFLLEDMTVTHNSSLALQMAKTAIQRRRAKVLYFSLEMIGEELIERLVSAGAGIDTDLMRSKKLNDQNWKAINRTLAEVSGWPLVIDDKTQNIEAIRARAVSHSFNPGLDLIVVDYGQRVTTSKHYQNRDAELGAVSAAFKRLANDLQVPVVVVASLSRECERRHDKRPILSDLRDTGNWEYDADVVIFAYWDAVYNPESENQNIIDFIVSKHRGGKTGIVSTYFRKHLTMFADLEVKRQELNY